MVVVDTNVLAYLLIEGPQTVHARTLFSQDADWRSEPLILIELTNILATLQRVQGLPMAQALSALETGRRIVEPGLHDAEHAEVLALASRYGVSAYDARFLAVAQDLQTVLVTEDAKLRKAAPRLTCSLVEALG